MSTYLNSGRLNLSLLRGEARTTLSNLFEKRPGNKILVWDASLAGLYGLVAEFTLLQRLGVLRMFNLSPSLNISASLPVGSSVSHIIFLIRPTLTLMDQVAEVMKRETNFRTSSGAGDAGISAVEYHLMFVPQRNSLCERRLQELGVFGDFGSVMEHGLYLVPIDSDVMSLEMGGMFREINFENDLTGLYTVARSVMQLQSHFGLIPNVLGQGRCAKQVYDLMVRMREELTVQDPETARKQQQLEPQIDSLILLDRSVDLLTPCLTPFTYEGLIDEVIGINNGSIKLLSSDKSKAPDDRSSPNELTADKASDKSKSAGSRSIQLNSGNDIYRKLRDSHFSAVGEAIRDEIATLKVEEDERRLAVGGPVSELRRLVDRLPAYQAAIKSVELHTDIGKIVNSAISEDTFKERLKMESEFLSNGDVDLVSPYIEDCIAREEALDRVLRLIGIQSFVAGGLKVKVLDYYRREIIQTYGYVHALTLLACERIGLFRLLTGASNFPTLSSKLILNKDKYDDRDPRDMNYLYRGYAPLSVRIAQFLASSDWRANEALLRMLPCQPTLDSTQPLPAGLHPRPNSQLIHGNGGRNSGSATAADKRLILVYLIGGATRGEIAGLRYLSKVGKINSDFILATTKLVNGRTFLEPLIATETFS